MFKLNVQIPDDQLEKFAKRYDGADSLTLRACFLLLRSSSKFLGELETIVRRYNLNQSRFLILHVLNQSESNALTVSEITEKLDISRATTSILLDGLERDGLTSRTVHEVDRRRIVVTLTQQGTVLMDQLLPQVYGKIGDTLNCLTASEKDELIKMLNKISDNL